MWRRSIRNGADGWISRCAGVCVRGVGCTRPTIWKYLHCPFSPRFTLPLPLLNCKHHNLPPLFKSTDGKSRGSVELALELIPLEPLTSDFGETDDGEVDEVRGDTWVL